MQGILTTLSKAAQQWFSQLDPNNIHSFAGFSQMFLPRATLALFNMWHWEGKFEGDFEAF